MSENIIQINKNIKNQEDTNSLDLFDNEIIGQVLSSNPFVLTKHWIKFQQKWVNGIYSTFHDYDKYIIIMYLVSITWKYNSNLFKFESMDEYYSKNEVNLPNINLAELSENLNTPKETIRRKLIELEKQNIIKRKGQKITLNRLALNVQIPEESIKNLSIFFEKLSILLSAEDWFGPSISRENIELYFKKYFTIFWSRFLLMQIPFLMRWKKIFGDLESWIIWANIGIHQAYDLEKTYLERNNEDLLTSISKKNLVDMKNKMADSSKNLFLKQIINNIPKRGVNASSISEISGIPRATVMRKLNKLLKEKNIIRNDKLEYFLGRLGKLNEKIFKNYEFNRKQQNLFVTEIFNLIKKSSLIIKK
jgi:DNA-binding Lrp family transcriptional regulator